MLWRANALGVRHKFTEQFEGEANIDFVDVDEFDDTTLRLGGRYYFTPAWSAGLAYSTSDEEFETVSGNLRWNF